MNEVKKEVDCFYDCIEYAKGTKRRGDHLVAVEHLQDAIRSLHELHMLGLIRKQNRDDDWLKHEQAQTDKELIKMAMEVNK